MILLPPGSLRWQVLYCVVIATSLRPLTLIRSFIRPFFRSSSLVVISKTATERPNQHFVREAIICLTKRFKEWPRPLQLNLHFIFHQRHDSLLTIRFRFSVNLDKGEQIRAIDFWSFIHIGSNPKLDQTLFSTVLFSLPLDNTILFVRIHSAIGLSIFFHHDKCWTPYRKHIDSRTKLQYIFRRNITYTKHKMTAAIGKFVFGKVLNENIKNHFGTVSWHYSFDPISDFSLTPAV